MRITRRTKEVAAAPRAESVVIHVCHQGNGEISLPGNLLHFTCGSTGRMLEGCHVTKRSFRSKDLARLELRRKLAAQQSYPDVGRTRWRAIRSNAIRWIGLSSFQ